MTKSTKPFSKILRSIAALSTCAVFAIPAHADSAGRGLTAQFEKDYLTFIINHHYSALRMTELAAGTDLQRDAMVNNPQEGTSPTPDTSATPAKASDDEIKSMARQENRTQREEIATAQRFLKEWYGVDYMPQLSPDSQRGIQLLEQTSAGAQFNRKFLEVFSSHHYRALMPSQNCRVKADIQHGPLKHYCEGIVGNQTRQINDMRMQLCKKFNLCDYQPTMDIAGKHS
jgi:uncharacterized protein (DUF305 family)